MPPVHESVLSSQVDGIFKRLSSTNDTSIFKLWANSGPSIKYEFGVCIRGGSRCAFFYDDVNKTPQKPTNLPDSLEFEPVENHRILIRCRNPLFHNEFNQLIKEWALRADQDAHPLDALARVISDWNRFLNQTTEMSRSKVIGLFGELHFLESALGHHPPGAIEYWLGCSDGTMDFRKGNKAVEVKASTSRDGCKVTFHGLDQLLLKDGEEARIVFYRLELIGAADDQAPSIGIMAERIRQKIGHVPGAVAAFNEKLFEAGGHPPGLAPFENTGFRVLANMACPVDNHIPRVTRDMLGGNAAKIVSIEYSVELSGILKESAFQQTVDWFCDNQE